MVFKRKRVIEDLEPNLTRVPIYASKPDNLSLAEEANSYEAFT